jgi:hypothetical protein
MQSSDSLAPTVTQEEFVLTKHSFIIIVVVAAPSPNAAKIRGAVDRVTKDAGANFLDKTDNISPVQEHKGIS